MQELKGSDLKRICQYLKWLARNMCRKFRPKNENCQFSPEVRGRTSNLNSPLISKGPITPIYTLETDLTTRYSLKTNNFRF